MANFCVSSPPATKNSTPIRSNAFLSLVWYPRHRSNAQRTHSARLPRGLDVLRCYPYSFSILYFFGRKHHFSKAVRTSQNPYGSTKSQDASTPPPHLIRATCAHLLRCAPARCWRRESKRKTKYGKRNGEQRPAQKISLIVSVRVCAACRTVRFRHGWCDDLNKSDLTFF